MKKRIITLIMATGLILSITGCGGSGGSSSTSSASGTSEVAMTESNTNITSTPEATPEETQDPLEGFSFEERNAITQATSYIEHSAFSRAGLVQQLSSEAEGYSAESAEKAVKYLEDNNLVDWKEEACEQAESYLQHSAYSRADLLKQLTSDAEKYTEEEAEYAMQEVYDKK